MNKILCWLLGHKWKAMQDDNETKRFGLPMFNISCSRPGCDSHRLSPTSTPEQFVKNYGKKN